MKFEFNWANGLRESYVLILLMRPQYERLWLKGQRSTLTFGTIYSHCLIRLNISSENNDKGFHSFQKNQLFRKFPI